LDKIYVSIASYKDTELVDTVYSLLRRAKNPERVFVSIFSQDETHPKLDNIFKLFGVKEFNYEKVHFSKARGVGYARLKTQQQLSLDFKYYLQVDSHTRFINHWDEVLISEYELSREFWKMPIVFSSYPVPYTYDENGNEVIKAKKQANLVKIEPVENSFLYKTEYQEIDIGVYGEVHPHFCAGFVFCLSEYMLKVPYDKNIYFIGEEHTMSIRLFCEDISIVAPPRSYVYHHYYGENTREKHWEIDPEWGEYEKASYERINLFFNFDPLDGYGISNKEKYKFWVKEFLYKNKKELG
jgi:hypothetical protein